MRGEKRSWCSEFFFFPFFGIFKSFGLAISYQPISLFIESIFDEYSGELGNFNGINNARLFVFLENSLVILQGNWLAPRMKINALLIPRIILFKGLINLQISAIIL